MFSPGITIRVQATRHTQKTGLPNNVIYGILEDDLGDFSQLKNRTLQPRKRPVDLRAVADVVLTHSAPLAAGKPLRLVDSTMCLPLAR